MSDELAFTKKQLFISVGIEIVLTATSLGFPRKSTEKFEKVPELLSSHYLWL